MADALRAKEQQRLEAKQAEWATKKWMWIIDAREGCVPAYIVKEAGDEVTLKLNDGNVSERALLRRTQQSDVRVQALTRRASQRSDAPTSSQTRAHAHRNAP